MSQNPSYVFGADIGPSLIVRQTGDPHTVVRAVNGELPLVGVSHEGTREAPIPGITPLAGKAGESARIYGDTEVCEVIAGANIASGVYVTANADSHAVAAADGDYYVGRTLAAAISGERARIQVQLGRVAVGSCTTTTAPPTTTTTTSTTTTTVG